MTWFQITDYFCFSHWFDIGKQKCGGYTDFSLNSFSIVLVLQWVFCVYKKFSGNMYAKFSFSNWSIQTDSLYFHSNRKKMIVLRRYHKIWKYSITFKYRFFRGVFFLVKHGQKIGMSYKYSLVSEQCQNRLVHIEIYVLGEILFLIFCVDFSPQHYIHLD